MHRLQFEILHVKVLPGDMMKKRTQGIICLLLATVIWGAAFVAQSVGMDHIGPFTFQAVRCFLAVIGLLPVILVSDRFKNDQKTFIQRWQCKKLWKAGLFCGIPLFLACNLQQMGLVDTDAGKSGFLTAMYIVIVPVFGLISKKKMSITLPISVILAVVGLYMLSCVGVTQIQIGDLLLIACALMFALQIICVEKFASDIDPLRLNLLQALVCAVLSSVIALWMETPNITSILNCWLPLSYTGFLSMGAAYALQIMGQKNLDSAPAALIMSLESVFAVIFGALILKERMSLYETIGCVLMFAAVLLSQVQIDKKAKCI